MSIRTIREQLADLKIELQKLNTKPEPAFGQVYRDRGGEHFMIVPLEQFGMARFTLVSVNKNYAGRRYCEQGFGGHDEDFTYIGMFGDLYSGAPSERLGRLSDIKAQIAGLEAMIKHPEPRYGQIYKRGGAYYMVVPANDGSHALINLNTDPGIRWSSGFFNDREDQFEYIGMAKDVMQVLIKGPA
jgi:hypothetical protein